MGMGLIGEGRRENSVMYFAQDVGLEVDAGKIFASHVF